MSPRRSFALTVAAVAAVIGLSACGSDDEKSSSTTGAPTATTVAPSDTAMTPISDPAATVVETTAVESTGPATSDEITEATTDDTTKASTTAPETTVAPATVPPTTAPDALSELPGVSALEVTVGGTDAARPTFTWAPPAAATSYQLVVQSADGAPLWAWTGAQTSVVLGGTERAADVEGPTLTGPSQVRVYALDAASTLVAVSGWVALPSA